MLYWLQQSCNSSKTQEVSLKSTCQIHLLPKHTVPYTDQQPPARYLMGLYTGARIGWFQVGDSVDKRSSKGWQESLIQWHLGISLQCEDNVSYKWTHRLYKPSQLLFEELALSPTLVASVGYTVRGCVWTLWAVAWALPAATSWHGDTDHLTSAPLSPENSRSSDHSSFRWQDCNLWCYLSHIFKCIQGQNDPYVSEGIPVVGLSL